MVVVEEEEEEDSEVTINTEEEVEVVRHREEMSAVTGIETDRLTGAGVTETETGPEIAVTGNTSPYSMSFRDTRQILSLHCIFHILCFFVFISRRRERSRSRDRGDRDRGGRDRDREDRGGREREVRDTEGRRPDGEVVPSV